MTEIKIVREDEKATAILKAIRQIDEGAELEPVVRCKDCKNKNPDIHRPEGRCLCERLSRWVFDNEFCSQGERGEGE